MLLKIVQTFNLFQQSKSFISINIACIGVQRLCHGASVKDHSPTLDKVHKSWNVGKG